MPKTQFGWTRNKKYYAKVKTFTRVPKLLEDVDSGHYDFEALVLDPRNFRDRKTQILLQHIIRQLSSRPFDNGDLPASGIIYLKPITELTGMDIDTIKPRLDKLEERGIIVVTRPQRQNAQKPPYHVSLNLNIRQWQGIVNYHRVQPAEAFTD